jgi:hypothetical protein
MKKFGDALFTSARTSPSTVAFASRVYSVLCIGASTFQTEYTRDAYASAPESAHQQWGGSPHRTEHWLSVAEGNCVAERRGGEQPEANDQSIIKKMMNSIRPDALASLLAKGEAQNGKRPGKGERQLRDLTCGKNSERRDGSAWGGWR